VIIGEGGKKSKPANTRKMALLISVCTIIYGVKVNASGNYIHMENR
jgi:hypothetical protein